METYYSSIDMAIDNPVLEEIRELFEGVDNERVRGALSYLESCYDPNTPSHELNRMTAMATILNVSPYFPDRDAFFDRAMPLVKKVNEHLEDLGYRDDIATFVEHKILGSTVYRGYADEPHKPIGIIKGELSVEEANKARMLERRHSAFEQYFGLGDDFVQVSLEPLDADGNTVRDPRVLDELLNPLQTTYSADFPHRRAQLDIQ